MTSCIINTLVLTFTFVSGLFNKFFLKIVRVTVNIKFSGLEHYEEEENTKKKFDILIICSSNKEGKKKNNCWLDFHCNFCIHAVAFALVLSLLGHLINSLWYPCAAVHCWFGARSASLYSLVWILLNPVTSAWPDICSTPQDCPLEHTHINTDYEYQPSFSCFLILVLLHNQGLNEWNTVQKVLRWA